MPTYQYRAKKGLKELSDGLLEADSRLEALDKLAQQGFYPLIVEEFHEGGNKSWGFLKGISKKDVSFFTQHVADLLESNIPLLKALDLVQEQADNPRLRRLILVIMEQVRGGKSFSESLEESPDVFSPLYVHLVHAGEVGGMLSATMGRLAAFIAQEEEFQSRILAALAYPAFVMLIGGMTIVFLMLFVVPRLTAMFVDTGQGLPWIAEILSTASRVMSSLPGVATLVLVVIVVLWVMLRMPKQTKAFFSRVFYKIPIWGSVMKKGMLARFARTLSMLLTGGVPIIRALQVVSHVLDHPALYGPMKKVIEDVEQGKSFSEGLRRVHLFPVFVCQMIAIGEEANTLEKALEKVAVTYERETDRAMKLATSLLEPIMIVGVGSMIGVIVIGMLLPIFQISTFVK